MTDKELMQQALEALEHCVATCFDRYAHEQVMSRPEHFVNQNITALRERLAHPYCDDCGGTDLECPLTRPATREEKIVRPGVYEVPVEQEPVAWQWLTTAHFRKRLPKDAEPGAWNPLYAAIRSRGQA